jgi:hypothetical protein
MPTANNTYDIGSSSFVYKDVYATTFHGALQGNASTASTWQTARTLTIGNTGKSVDGSADVSWSLVEIGAATRATSKTIWGQTYIDSDGNFCNVDGRLVLNYAASNGTAAA